MKKYVKFIDKASHTVTLTKGYTTDDEYFEVMDNINPEQWEVIFYEIKQ